MVITGRLLNQDLMYKTAGRYTPSTEVAGDMG